MPLKISASNVFQSVAILAYIVLIVFSPSIHFINYIHFHDAQRVLQLILLTLIALEATLIQSKFTQTIAIGNKVKFGIIFFLALTLASITTSIQPRYAVIEVTVYSALCLLALFTARMHIKYGERFIKLLTYALIASIMLYMLSFYTGYLSAMAVGKPIKWPAPFYGFSNIRLFQQYQLWTLGIICLPLLAYTLKRSTVTLFYIILSLWWVLLFYAASRGVTIAWLVGVVTTFVVYKKQALPFLRIQLISAAIGCSAYFLLFKKIPLWLASATLANEPTPTIITSTIFRSTTYDRLDLWKAAYVMIINFPILGVGPMHFYFYTPHGTHPHNSLLQIASEFGLPITFAILLTACSGIYYWMKRYNTNSIKTESKQSISLTIILFFTIVANASYSLVEGVIVMPISQVLMFTMIGLTVSHYMNKSPKKINVKSKSMRPKVIQIFSIIVLFALALSTMPELVRGLSSKKKIYKPNEQAFSLQPNEINPRLWMQQRRIEK